MPGFLQHDFDELLNDEGEFEGAAHTGRLRTNGNAARPLSSYVLAIILKIKHLSFTYTRVSFYSEHC